MHTKLDSRPLHTKGVALWSPALDVQRRKTDPTELLNLMRNHVPIDWLVSKNMISLPRSLPVVGSLNNLLALLRPASEYVVEIYTNHIN